MSGFLEHGFATGCNVNYSNGLARSGPRPPKVEKKILISTWKPGVENAVSRE